MTIISIIARRSILAILGAGLSVTTLSGAAQARETSPAPAAAPVANAAAISPMTPSVTQRYCVITPPVTGTRLSLKTCRTRADWLKQGFDPLDPK